MIQFTNSSKQLEPSATLSVNAKIKQYKAKGIDVVNLSIGQSPFPVHRSIKDAISKNADKNEYLPAQGVLPLRQAISDFYDRVFNLKFSPTQVFVGPGSKMLLYATLFTLDGPLLLPTPSWVSYAPQAKILGKKIINIQAKQQNSYQITPEDLELCTTTKGLDPSEQKLLLLNYPNNPTGTCYTSEDLQAFAEIARKKSILILADEIYALTTFDKTKFHSMAEFYPEGTLIFSGLAKDRSLGGYRIGTLMIPKELMEVMPYLLRFASQTWACVAGPIQYGVIEAYRMQESLHEYVDDCTALHEMMVTYVFSRLNEVGIHCVRPQGGFYLFINWTRFQEDLHRHHIFTSQDLAQILIEKWKLGAVASAAFGMPDTHLGIRLAIVDYDGDRVMHRFQEDSSKIKNSPVKFIESMAPKLELACQTLEEFTRWLRS